MTYDLNTTVARWLWFTVTSCLPPRASWVCRNRVRDASADVAFWVLRATLDESAPSDCRESADILVFLVEDKRTFLLPFADSLANRRLLDVTESIRGHGTMTHASVFAVASALTFLGCGYAPPVAPDVLFNPRAREPMAILGMVVIHAGPA